ncbi:uncharacterized protein LOC120339111 isoform X1 [Styela clava]
MSRGGGVGGPATLSSFRVQKAFSINFRENKRLRATIRLIEGEHMRAIRQVKQEITETKLWLKGVQENTGYSQHGIPNTERHFMFSPTASRRMSLPASVASNERGSPRPATRARTSQPDIMYGQPIEEDNEPGGPDASPPHVRFAWTEQGPRRGSRDPMSTSVAPQPPATAGPETGVIQLPEPRPFSRRQSFLPKEDRGQPLVVPETVTEEEKKETASLYGGAMEAKPRIHSATSMRSNQSLNAYQRRHMLQSMVVKKQSSLEGKKDIHRKECVRVNSKVLDYLNNLSEKMKITLPDVSLFDHDPEKHNTPFAKDVNITA